MNAELDISAHISAWKKNITIKSMCIAELRQH